MIKGLASEPAAALPRHQGQLAAARQNEIGDAEAQLRSRLDELLEDSLGLSILPRLRSAPRVLPRLNLPLAPARGAATMATVYLGFFVALPWGISRLLGLAIDRQFAIMLLFQVYGAFWSAWATATTRMARAIRSILDIEVLPRLSERSARFILVALDQPGFQRRRLLQISWVIGIAAGTLAAGSLYHDLPMLPTWALAFWGIGWALLYTTAAKVVIVSRFYETIAQAVADDPDCLYPLNPAKSPLVTSLKAVSQRMLLFWFGIVVSIAAIIPFSLYARSLEEMQLATSGRSAMTLLHLTIYSFVLGHLAITSIFSFGLGTAVFLRSEGALRRAIRICANATLFNLKAYAEELMTNDPSDDNLESLKELSAFYDQVSAGGSYQAMIIGGLSVLLPFVPLISLLIGHKGS